MSQTCEPRRCAVVLNQAAADFAFEEKMIFQAPCLTTLDRNEPVAAE
jgi:hypothetical protein